MSMVRICPEGSEINANAPSFVLLSLSVSAFGTSGCGTTRTPRDREIRLWLFII